VLSHLLLLIRVWLLLDHTKALLPQNEKITVVEMLLTLIFVGFELWLSKTCSLPAVSHSHIEFFMQVQNLLPLFASKDCQPQKESICDSLKKLLLAHQFESRFVILYNFCEE
jgi:hypothetical protein